MSPKEKWDVMERHFQKNVWMVNGLTIVVGGILLKLVF